MAIGNRNDILDPDGKLLDVYTTVQFYQGDDGRHFCKRGEELETLFYGSAVTYCESDQDGRVWVKTYTKEYGNEVLFCPFCGIPSTAIKD